VARHRSPEGRRAHLEPPLSPALAAAGVGGAYRTVAFQPPTSRSAAPAGGSSGSAGSPTDSFTSSTPVRFVAIAIAGTALAATGQHLLAQAVPTASDGAAALRAGIDDLFAPAPQPAAGPADVPATPIVTAAAADTTAFTALPTAAIGAELVAAEPVVADAADLVKAADLQRLAAEEAARAAEQEQARIAEEQRALAAREAESAAAAATATSAASATAGGGQLVDGRFTSAFGARNGRAHEGIDIAAPIGTPIHAPLAGTVVDSGPATGFGLWVRVEHADGTITTYGHVNRSLVSVGEEVEAGEVIAEVGNRGQSTGPHLHFEVTSPGGTKINPRPWLSDVGVPV
jgi:murein DD-endopeptidase MepM/ murein hydrolase activator NlpD